MPNREHVLRVVGEWVKKAEEDWLTARHLMTLSEDYALDAVRFHAQQCAEKYLKSLLVLHSLPVPKTHDLRKLVRLVPVADAPDVTVEDLQLLTGFAVDMRYPGSGSADRSEAVSALKIADVIRDYARGHLPEESLQMGD